MYREAYVAAVSVTPDANALSRTWVVLVPRRDADIGDDDDDTDVSSAACRRELQVLEALQLQQPLPFRSPKPLGCLPGPHGTALVREFIPGIPLDLRAGRQGKVRPWEVVAEVAAGVHEVDTQGLPQSFVQDRATRRDHALIALRTIEALQLPEARDAEAWAREHLPPAEPATLLHGDLLGQNILLDPTEPVPYAAIDWARAEMGDPAYDLAIVTRGVRQPFQIAGGMQHLLEAYGKARGGDAHVTLEQVRFHELCLAALWCKAAMAAGPNNGIEPAEEAIALLRRVLDMAITARA
jgi:aminoglycoside phosphotransferase (APT) family kinase protein